MVCFDGCFFVLGDFVRIIKAFFEHLCNFSFVLVAFVCAPKLHKSELEDASQVCAQFFFFAGVQTI